MRTTTGAAGHADMSPLLMLGSQNSGHHALHSSVSGAAWKVSLGTREPPRIAEWIARVMTERAPYGDAIVGDMREGYARMLRDTPGRARRWYWRKSLSIAAHYLPARVRSAIEPQPKVHQSPPDSGAAMAFNDLRFALRTLRRAPGFAFAAIVALGLGTGATAAVFSLLQGVVLRPLPYEQPETLAHEICRFLG